MGLDIDLNADIGEECGDDAEILRFATSANVAAGAHAGGGETLERTMRLAASLGRTVGAHPSYPDRPGFGRHSMAHLLGDRELVQAIAAQVVDAGHAAARAGVGLAHVKPHGALYHDAADDPRVARALVAAVADAAADLGGGELALVGAPAGRLREAASGAGIRFVPEGFADRRYGRDGRLLARGLPGAVIDDPADAAAQAVGLAVRGGVRCGDGTWLDLEVATLCVHGDTPRSVLVARAVSEALAGCSVEVVSWATRGGAPGSLAP